MGSSLGDLIRATAALGLEGDQVEQAAEMLGLPRSAGPSAKKLVDNVVESRTPVEPYCPHHETEPEGGDGCAQCDQEDDLHG